MSEIQEHLGWYSRGYLPHADGAGLIQHITFHLADSLPRFAIERMSEEVKAFPEDQRNAFKRRRIHELLDAGFGSCILRNEACARAVEDTLLFGDGTRYHLSAWVVMPNHVHVLIEQIHGWPLGKVVQAWKRHSTKIIRSLSEMQGTKAECNSAIPGECSGTQTDCKSAIPGSRIAELHSACSDQSGSALWQRDYWDRFIRDEHHFDAVAAYIEQNPVAAGLASNAEEWAFGSARRKEQNGGL